MTNFHVTMSKVSPMNLMIEEEKKKNEQIKEHCLLASLSNIIISPREREEENLADDF